MPVTPVEVVCAIIVDGSRVLVAKRQPGGAAGGKWEFPGGKVKPGESNAQAVVREIAEELACSVEVVDQAQALEANLHHYPSICIRLVPIICSLKAGPPLALEHEELEWLSLSEMRSLDWAEADIPIVEQILAGKVGGLA